MAASPRRAVTSSLSTMAPSATSCACWRRKAAASPWCRWRRISAATGEYAVPVIRDLLATGKPLFGICLGHQLLALALGGKTRKMPIGHRGANHPVKDLVTGKVEITSQNHGFCVLPETLPKSAEVTHVSLF